MSLLFIFFIKFPPFLFMDAQSGDNSYSDGIFMVMQTIETETKTNKILLIINANLQ